MKSVRTSTDLSASIPPIATRNQENRSPDSPWREPRKEVSEIEGKAASVSVSEWSCRAARHRWENRQVECAGAEEPKLERTCFKRRNGISKIEGEGALGSAERVSIDFVNSVHSVQSSALPRSVKSVSWGDCPLLPAIRGFQQSENLKKFSLNPVEGISTSASMQAGFAAVEARKAPWAPRAFTALKS